MIVDLNPLQVLAKKGTLKLDYLIYKEIISAKIAK